MDTFYNVYYEYINKYFLNHSPCYKRKYVIYPNGNIASIVGDVLKNNYNIKPAFIVDNYRYDGNSVLNLVQAKKITDDTTYYLICSDKEEIYDDVRIKLKEYIDEDHIIDLFPRNIELQYIEYVNKLLDEIDNDIEG